MLTVLLVRPGLTDFDEQGRIKGNLDIPLNERGTQQVARTVGELANRDIAAIYTSPCECCEQTAEALANHREVKVKAVKGLKNLDHGLWHGKLIKEVKQQQPKVYRQWQEHPETVCPPQGESLVDATERVETALAKALKKHKDGVIAFVVPEPLASVLRRILSESALGDLWKAECDAGGWEAFQLDAGGRIPATT